MTASLLASPGDALVSFVRGPRGTRIERLAARSPTRLLTPRNHGEGAWVYASSLGGGFVDGDAVRLDLAAGPGAVGLFSTQASTKVYRSPRGTSQHVRAQVAAEGWLLYVPDPLVCFEGARFSSEARIDVEPGGSLVWLDVLGAGRLARGERWAFTRYAARTRVRLGGRDVLHEATLLDEAHGPIAPRFGAHNLVGSLILLGPRTGTLRARARAAATPPRRGAELVVAPSELEGASEDGGLVLRFAAPRTELVTKMLRTVLAELSSLLGDDPFARKH